jgi:DNA-binding NarL/FixJ family response regulator
MNIYLQSTKEQNQVLLKGWIEEITETDVEFKEATQADITIVDTTSILPEDMHKNQRTILFALKTLPYLLKYNTIHDINGVLAPDMSKTSAYQTIEKVLQGEIYYSEEMLSLLFSSSINESQEKVNRLTTRELEIISMMMHDLTNEMIANELELSVRTVNAHKGNIMRKTGMKTTSGLIKLLLDHSPEFRIQF